MQREIILTSDGSHTISVPELHVTYHSIHGAIRESEHVYIKNGLLYDARRTHGTSILEIGFGTGLNALLTYIGSGRTTRPVYYTTLEPNPLSREEALSLNYCGQMNRPDLLPLFEKMHACEWEKDIALDNTFLFRKQKTGFQDLLTDELFHLVYYDAFAPTAQPELWTKKIFEKLYGLMLPEGILVTYCSKGNVRRAMTDAGFSVEKLPGPPRKREMLRARK